MRYVGYDSNGVPRVYAEHANADLAETYCREEAFKYLRRRPDCGPFAKWTFVHESVDSNAE